MTTGVACVRRVKAPGVLSARSFSCSGSHQQYDTIDPKFLAVVKGKVQVRVGILMGMGLIASLRARVRASVRMLARHEYTFSIIQDSFVS